MRANAWKRNTRTCRYKRGKAEQGGHQGIRGRREEEASSIPDLFLCTFEFRSLSEVFIFPFLNKSLSLFFPGDELISGNEKE
jgi:hypothetical protein